MLLDLDIMVDRSYANFWTLCLREVFSCFLDSALSDIILFGFVVLVRGRVMSGCPHFEKC